MTHPQLFHKREMIAEYTVTYSLASPLLIMEPQETSDNKIYPLKYNKKNEYFIPGSSVKGVLREYSEKIFQHLLEETEEEKTENEKSKKTRSAEEKYKQLTSLQTLFGKENFKSRLSVADVTFHDHQEPAKAVKIAIDRFRGGPVAGALYELHSINEGTFSLKLTLHNPEKWQLYWTTFLLKQLGKGRITLGSKSSLNFGKLDMEQFQLQLTPYSSRIKEEWKEVLQLGEKEEAAAIFPGYLFQNMDELGRKTEQDWQSFLPAEEESQ